MTSDFDHGVLSLDVFGSLYESDAAHYVVPVLHSEYFPDFFRYGNSAAGNYLCKEGNVLLVNLDWQTASPSGSIIPGRYNVLRAKRTLITH